MGASLFQTDRWTGGQFIAMSRGAGGLDVAQVPPAPDFHAVYHQHIRYVFRTLRRLGARPAELDDLAQEVFAVVFQRWSDYDPTRPLEPWLFGIAFRVCSVHRRTRSRRVPEVALDGVDPAEDDGADPETSLADRRARALVLRALDALEIEQRAVFVMHEIDEQPIPEVARALGIPLNTAYSRLRAGRARFAARVRRLQRAGGGGGA
jgi:RNA polymerase sigma-70 factor (ECF subfamily)